MLKTILQDRNINILAGTTVENKGKLILILDHVLFIYEDSFPKEVFDKFENEASKLFNFTFFNNNPCDCKSPKH